MYWWIVRVLRHARLLALAEPECTCWQGTGFATLSVRGKHIKPVGEAAFGDSLIDMRMEACKVSSHAEQWAAPHARYRSSGGQSIVTSEVVKRVAYVQSCGTWEFGWRTPCEWGGLAQDDQPCMCDARTVCLRSMLWLQGEGK